MNQRQVIGLTPPVVFAIFRAARHADSATAFQIGQLFQAAWNCQKKTKEN
jgi:hypothetical protein